MLFRNPNYVLVNVVRAPQWGSKMARIITHDAMMEMTGDGEAAVLITDDHLCETIRSHSRQTVLGGLGVKNPPTYYGHGRECEKKVADFKDHYTKMEKLLKPKSSGDEESED